MIFIDAKGHMVSDKGEKDGEILISEVASPQEGLPPCVKVALLDNRLAVFYDRSCGCGQLFDATLQRYCCMAGPVSRYREAPGHPGCRMPQILMDTEMIHLDTNELDKAEAIFERGELWVRMGELDES